MSKQATENILSKVNRLIDVEESYQAPKKLMEIILDKGSAKNIFLKFSTEFQYDLSYDWFIEYCEDEHADRKKKKQDFTPQCISKLICEMQGNSGSGLIYEPAAGTGSTIIPHWWGECKKCRYPWEYHPNNYLYWCEELSDRALPFLLFNILIRGMNAIVIHGNTLTREAKEVYYCTNQGDSFVCFSDLIKLPHINYVEVLCDIKFRS